MYGHGHGESKGNAKQGKRLTGETSLNPKKLDFQPRMIIMLENAKNARDQIIYVSQNMQILNSLM